MTTYAHPDGVPVINEPLALFEALLATAPRHPAAERAGSAVERLLALGAGALTPEDLLSILLGGRQDAGLVARELLDLRGGLHGLAGCSLFDLLEAPGIGESRAVQILAAEELGKLLLASRRPLRPVISSPADVDAFLRPRLAGLEQETFVVLVLNTKNEVIASPAIGVGTISACLVHARDVFRIAVKASAASVLLAHNHPSGDTAPSPEDRTVTQQLVQAGKLLGIRVLDHVILGRNYHSMKESGHV